MYILHQKTMKWMSVVLFFLMAFSNTPTIAEAASSSKKAPKAYVAQKLIQSHESLTLAPDATLSFEVGFKNIGTKNWVGTASTPLQLRSRAKRESYFYDAKAWVSPTVAVVKQTRVEPGRLVYFTVLMHAPKKTGAYIEEMDLLVGSTKIASSRISLPIRVQEDAATVQTQINSLAIAKEATPPTQTPQTPSKNISALKLIQSDTSLVMPALGRNAFEIGFKNTGKEAWPSSGSNALSLHSLAKKESYFSDTTWRTGTIVKEVPGGAVGELVYVNFVLNAPRTEGKYIERIALFNGTKMIPGTEIAVPITVTRALPVASLAVAKIPTVEPTPSPVTPLQPPMVSTPTTPFVPQGIIDDIKDTEQSIRVGITHSNDPIQITASKDYEVRDTSGALLGTQISGSVTTIIYNRTTQLYAVTMQEGSVTTSHAIRLTSSPIQTASGNTVRSATTDSTTTATSIPSSISPSVAPVPAPNTSPDPNTVFEILTFSNRPGWSTSINDNKFRALLEVRYASSTDRIWVINELMLEQYLKGIAETSNSSPYEYQKALLIAARTYAVHHIRRSTKYVQENFTVKTTDADQVYRGYNAEIRLPNVSRAVSETRGMIVTYQGQLAITPYYSQSDGRTRSWEEVWAGGPYAWLKAVADPGCAGLKMLGHGVGMSARGALLMALEGKGFEEILKYYYTGIELRRIY